MEAMRVDAVRAIFVGSPGPIPAAVRFLRASPFKQFRVRFTRGDGGAAHRCGGGVPFTCWLTVVDERGPGIGLNTGAEQQLVNNPLPVVAFPFRFGAMLALFGEMIRLLSYIVRTVCESCWLGQRS